MKRNFQTGYFHFHNKLNNMECYLVYICQLLKQRSTLKLFSSILVIVFFFVFLGEVSTILHCTDWLAFNSTFNYFDSTALCLGNQPTQDHLANEISNFIDQYSVDYIVQDGEDMVKQCMKSSHSHNYGDSNYANSEQGLDVIWTRIKQKYPNLILENCEDGGTTLT